MQVLTIINYTGLYLHQRFSVIQNQEADYFYFFHDVYIFTQLLGNFFFFLKALLMLRYVHSCSVASLALGCQLLPCAEHIIDF